MEAVSPSANWVSILSPGLIWAAETMTFPSYARVMLKPRCRVAWGLSAERAEPTRLILPFSRSNR